MAFFPRLAMGEFTPLFRMLDDYASHQISRGFPSIANSAASSAFFQPRFDVKETKASYELLGELPGVSQKDIEIEFADAQTLKISGRTEQYIESQQSGAPAIETQPEQKIIADLNANAHQASVEDESSQTTQAESTETSVAKNAESQTSTPSSRYWLSERCIGQFQRTFSFPDRVDSDAVRASLRDGILSVIVPKAQEMAKRRISIE